MPFKLEYTAQAMLDLLEIDIYLYEHSPTAVYKFQDAVDEQTATLVEHPFMYPIYSYDNRFRIMPLPYQYLCFYRVPEASRVLLIHRIFRGMRNIRYLL